MPHLDGKLARIKPDRLLRRRLGRMGANAYRTSRLREKYMSAMRFRVLIHEFQLVRIKTNVSRKALDTATPPNFIMLSVDGNALYTSAFSTLELS
jgi:hypothetical protein